jgi:hypothetical protein
MPATAGFRMPVMPIPPAVAIFLSYILDERDTAE